MAEYVDRLSEEFKEFENFVKEHHSDPDHVVYTLDKWYWMYHYFITLLKIKNGNAWLEGYEAAIEALKINHVHLKQKLTEYGQENNKYTG